MFCLPGELIPFLSHMCIIIFVLFTTDIVPSNTSVHQFTLAVTWVLEHFQDLCLSTSLLCQSVHTFVLCLIFSTE